MEVRLDLIQLIVAVSVVVLHVLVARIVNTVRMVRLEAVHILVHGWIVN